MAALQGIKRRIRSVSGIHQITKAQQLVAASKLRRVQTAALAPQAYTQAAGELLERLSRSPEVRKHPLFQERKVNKALTIVIAGDRGMAGAYNSNVLRALGRHVHELGVPQEAICVGRRASMNVSHARDVDEIASYEISNPEPDIAVVQPVLHTIIDRFLTHQVDVVNVIYTRFVSTVKQEVRVEQLLPIVRPEGKAVASEFEPEPEELVDVAVRRVLEAKVLQAVLEARASEEAARMMAMMNATDNAGELIGDLTLAYNNARQANITQELAEISGGAEAITAQ
ncbi:MAG TPA: ATP synthase F1 subunit gamma [Candidatus Saccharimonadia bacterium]|jgi:F-type H+-transporting ATPase subunit gamma